MPTDVIVKESGTPSSPSSQDSPPSPSPTSTAGGLALTLAVVAIITVAWLRYDKFEHGWHAAVALIAATLPTSALFQIAMAWLRRDGK